MTKTILFDQFSRYKACADILAKISTQNETILDVGSGVECVLGELLPNHKITYVDPLFSGFSKIEDNMIVGNIFTKELDEKSFDHVVCVDTLEHVPSNLRESFLERISKLSRKSIILACPCSDAGDAVETDKWLNDIYLAGFNKNYDWLDEHISYGLPSLSQTIKEIEKLGWHTQVTQNGYTTWLKQLLGFTICALESKSLMPHVNELSDYFNKNFSEYDYLEPCYRQVIVATKESLSFSVQKPALNSNIKQELNEKWKLVQKKIIASTSTIADKEREIDTLRNDLNNLRNDLNNLRITSKTELSALRKQKDAELDELRRKYELELQSLRIHLENAQKTILAIHQSFTFRMLRKYDNSLGKIFPIRPKKYLKSTKQQSTVEEKKSVIDDALKTNLNKKDVICFPIINWDYRQQRPHHLLNDLAQRGHRIFYLTVNLRNLEKPYDITKLANNVYQVGLSSSNFFDIYKDKFDNSQLDFVVNSFRTLRDDLKIDAFCIVDFPTWTPFVLKLRKLFNYKIIFDCLDDFHNFPNVTKERIGEEKTLLKESDLVIASSSSLFKKSKTITPKSVFIPNAGEFNHFRKSVPNDYLNNFQKPLIGYFGSIAEWFDIDLIKYVAKKRPNFNFIFLGHTYGADIRDLQKLNNIHFLGEQPYSELPKYLYHFDVCLIPFKKIPLIKATHPVKIYEYMAMGKPIVTTEMPELLLMKDLCYIAKDYQDFLNKLDLAINENDTTLRQKRIEFSSKNTWKDRSELLYSELQKIPSLNIQNHSKI